VGSQWVKPKEKMGLDENRLVEIKVSGSNHVPSIVIHKRKNVRERKFNEERMGIKRRTVSDIKTALRAKVRSAPRMRGGEYLEMFVLMKNKIRLEQERDNSTKRIEQIEKDISLIDHTLEILDGMASEKEDFSVNTEELNNLIPPNLLKTMAIDY
jgi:hypothetical protein